jgi:hypothetical protein
MSIEASLAHSEHLLKLRKNNVTKAEEERRGRDRSWIGKKIISLFVASVLIVLVAIVALAGIGASIWKEATEQLVTLLSSVLLPVITLVIGYYFGSEQ